MVLVLMDTENWRPTPPRGDQAVDTGDWRVQLLPDVRPRIVNKITETLKRHLPFSGQEGLQELNKIAVRLEEKTYSASISQQDYLRKISLKMLTVENKSQNTIPNPLQSNSPSNSNQLPDPVSLDSIARSRKAVGGDWQEEVNQNPIYHTDNWIPAPPPGGEAVVDTGDWRAQLPPDARHKIVNGIVETLLSHLPFSGQEELQNLSMVAVRYEEKIYSAAINQQDYLLKITSKMPPMENTSIPNLLQSNSPNSSNQLPYPVSLDQTAQTGRSAGGDWQEEVYQKIKAMKEMYLPELSEMHQKIVAKFQQNESLPQQPKPKQHEKLKVFKAMLERIINFLQVSKQNVLPNFKEKLGSYEKQIVNFINSNRPRKPLSSQQLSGPAQLVPNQMHSMQQSQSQITQVQPRENPINPAMQPNTMTQRSSLSQQSMMNSLQPDFNMDSGHGNALNSMQQVLVGSPQQNSVSASQQTNMNAMPNQNGLNMLQQNANSIQANSANALQHQHLKQQQLIKRFQQRQMHQQLLQQQQQLQQQEQQLLHQQARQHMPAQLQSGQAAVRDWHEEVYQNIRAMKEMVLD